MITPGSVMLFLAAIVIAVALNHLFLAFRIKRSGLHIAIFLTGLSGFIYFILVYAGYHAPLKTELLIRIYKYRLLMMQASFLTILWAYSIYYGLYNKRWRIAIYCSFGGLMLLSLILPVNILFRGNVAASYTIVLDTSVTMLMNGNDLWRILSDLSVALLIFFAVFTIIRYMLSRSQKEIFLQLICSGLLLIAGVLDHLTDSGIINTLYLVPFVIFICYGILSSSSLEYMVNDLRQNAERSILEEKWHTMVNEAELIIVELNTLGQVKYANPYLYKLTGYSEHEILGKDWFEIVLPQDYSYDVQGAFIELLANGLHPTYQNPIRTKSNQKRMISWFNVRLGDTKENITGSISIGVDITDLFNDKLRLEKSLDDARNLLDKLKK